MDFNYNSFVDMVHNLGKSSAGLEQDTTKLDTKRELNVFTSGFEAIKSKAKSEGAETYEMAALDIAMKDDMRDILGLDFGKKAGLTENTKKNDLVPAPAFSDDEISLENMMNTLAQLPDSDGVDMNKLREYNKKPLQSSIESQQAIETLKSKGFDEKLAAIIVEETPGAIDFLTKDFKNGTVERINGKMGEKLDVMAQFRDAGIIDELEKRFLA